MTSEAANTADKQAARLTAITTALDTAMYRCPERVWPGIAENYRTRSQVLFTSREANKAWLWNDRSSAEAATGLGATTEVSLEGLGPQWFSLFGEGTFQGVPTLGISLEKTQATNDAIIAGGRVPWPDYAASLTFHEGFHLLSGQRTWARIPGNRNTPYPQSWQPRYLTRMLRAALLAEVSRSPDTSPDLGPAAAWQARLAAEAPDDFARWQQLRVIEGSAMYAELISRGLAEVGCAASEAELQAAINRRVANFVKLDSFRGDQEGYELGMLAGVLLRRAARVGWEADVVAGNSPSTLLLDGAASSRVEDDPAAMQKAKAFVDEENSFVGPEVDSLLERLSSGGWVRIALSRAWLSGGSFSALSFVELVEQPGRPAATVSFRGVHQSPQGHRVDVNGQTVLTGPASTTSPCGGAATDTVSVVMVRADELRESAGLFAASPADGTVSFEGLPATRRTDATGVEWLCP